MVPALLAAMLLSGAPSVRLAIDERVPCQLGEKLAPALDAVGLPMGEGWLLEASSGPEWLHVRLRDPAGHTAGERAVPAGECAVLPRTVALLVKTWMSQPLRAPAVESSRAPPARTRAPPIAPEPQARPAPRPAPEETAAIPRAPPVIAGASPPSSLPSPASPAEGPPPVRTADPGPAPASAAPAPRALPVEPAPANAAAGPARSTSTRSSPEAPSAGAPTVTAEVLAGGAAAPGDLVTAHGQLAVEWSFERWGLALDAGLQSNRVAAGGAASMGLAFASLMGRFGFAPAERSALVFGLGARFTYLTVRSAVDSTGGGSLATGGPVASAEWRQTVTSGLFLAARAEVQLRARPEHFLVEGAGLTLPMLGMSAAVGAGWTFR